MDWDTLLSEQRIRKLSGGTETRRQNTETRSEIHRDYGRAVFSTTVRRLQDKAQVFPLEKIDAIHTRLTHSLEVSSVARGIAHGLSQELVKKGVITPNTAYDIETIGATCGLVHDIGNPPFGHFGEKAISDWFKSKAETFWGEEMPKQSSYRQDLLNFEGNAHTLRLLGKLQVLSDRHGLNLTAATFSALCKYTAHSLEIRKGDQAKKKLGYFTAEKNIIDLVRQETGTGDARNPITIIVEAADDIVYSVVDIEDAIKKCVIGWEDVKKAIKGTGKGIASRLIKESERQIKNAALPLSRDAEQEGIAQFFRTFLIGEGSKAVQKRFASKGVYGEIMAGTYAKEILYDTPVGSVYAALKSFAQQRVYNAKSILRLEILGYDVIHSLMDLFWQIEPGSDRRGLGGKLYGLMSQNYRSIFENPDDWEKSLPRNYRKALLVTDYICGMTDSFALNLHRELNNG